MIDSFISHLPHAFFSAGSAFIVASGFAAFIGWYILKDTPSTSAIEKLGPGDLEKASRIARQSYNIIRDSLYE